MTATAKTAHVATAEAAAMPAKRHGIGWNGGSSRCNSRCERDG
jgi:hypothetical protein